MTPRHSADRPRPAHSAPASTITHGAVRHLQLRTLTGVLVGVGGGLMVPSTEVRHAASIIPYARCIVDVCNQPGQAAPGAYQRQPEILLIHPPLQSNPPTVVSCAACRTAHLGACARHAFRRDQAAVATACWTAIFVGARAGVAWGPDHKLVVWRPW